MATLYPLPKAIHPDFVSPMRAPRGPVEIDWANPDTRGLQFFGIVTPYGMYDVVNQELYELPNAAEIAINEAGNWAAKYTNAGNETDTITLKYPIEEGSAKARNMTLMGVTKDIAPSGGTYSVALMRDDTTSTYHKGFKFSSIAGGITYIVNAGSSGGSGYISTPGVGQYHICFGEVYREHLNMRCDIGYFAPSNISSAGHATQGRDQNATFTGKTFDRITLNQDLNADFRIDMVAFWDIPAPMNGYETLIQSEPSRAYGIMMRPYQFLKPRTPLYYPVPAAAPPASTFVPVVRWI